MVSDRPVCIDLTRLISRVGRGPHTGIDRVEFAYLRTLLDRQEQLFGLVRTADGYVLLDRAGLVSASAMISGKQNWGPPDLRSRAALKLDGSRRGAEATLRRIAADRAIRNRLLARLGRSGGISELAHRALPKGTRYFNVGHSNMTEPVLSAMHAVPKARIAVFLHDTIPLDFPQTQRPGTVEAFRARMAAIARHADLVICPSDAACQDAARHLPEGTPILAVPLAIDLAAATPGDLPDNLRLGSTYFVSVGTIDPRKRQGLLIDLWARLGADAPPLVLAGSIGWTDSDLSRKLANLPANVFVAQGLSDGAVAALIERAAALLHPSLAEGFGIPPLEAILRGTPVIAADLPVYHETLGDKAVYLKSGELYHWENAVAEVVRKKTRNFEQEADTRPRRLTWDDHLDRVLRAV